MLAKYIMNVLDIRSDETVNPPFDEINDTRNGILLFSGLRRGFGDSVISHFCVSVNFVIQLSPCG